MLVEFQHADVDCRFFVDPSHVRCLSEVFRLPQCRATQAAKVDFWCGRARFTVKGTLEEVITKLGLSTREQETP